jgi:hypothetical protein
VDRLAIAAVCSKRRHSSPPRRVLARNKLGYHPRADVCLEKTVEAGANDLGLGSPGPTVFTTALA